jgi:hypothetical protein
MNEGKDIILQIPNIVINNNVDNTDLNLENKNNEEEIIQDELEEDDYIQTEKELYFIKENSNFKKIESSIELVKEKSLKVNFTGNLEEDSFVKDFEHLFNGEWTKLKYISNFQTKDKKLIKNERKQFSPSELEATIPSFVFKAFKLHLEKGEFEPFYCIN